MFTICLGVGKIITTIDQIWLFLFISKKENKMIVLTYANNLEIFENNGGIKPNTNYVYTFARGQHSATMHIHKSRPLANTYE